MIGNRVEKKTNPILWQTEAEQQLADASENMVRAIDAIKVGTNKDDEYLGALAHFCMAGTNLAQAYGADALGVGICCPAEIVRGKPVSVMECGGGYTTWSRAGRAETPRTT